MQDKGNTTMQPQLECPGCGNDDGSAIMGHEVRGVYDGVLVWECFMCSQVWPRRFGNADRLNQKAAEYADKLNQRSA